LNGLKIHSKIPKVLMSPSGETWVNSYGSWLVSLKRKS